MIKSEKKRRNDDIEPQKHNQETKNEINETQTKNNCQGAREHGRDLVEKKLRPI